jgi:hypothetical protein
MTMARETRLRFHLESQGAVWNHLDGSRSHLLIDPQAEARTQGPGFVRPIELWRASRWLRPPSVSVIHAGLNGANGSNGSMGSNDPKGGSAGLAGGSSADVPAGGSDGDLPLSPGDAVNLASVVDFISDVSAFRLGALGALIDAVAAALDGGPPVVLAAPDADQGALWIGAVSFFTPASDCLRLSFSTHERWDDLVAENHGGHRRGARVDGAKGGANDSGASGSRVNDGGTKDGGATGSAANGGGVNDADASDSGRRPLLSVVPQTDVDRLTRRDELPLVVIDPRVEAIFHVVEGVEYRRTHLGQPILITDASRRALDACCEDYAALERRIRRLDATGTTSSSSTVAVTDDGAEPAWKRLSEALAQKPLQVAEVRPAFENYLFKALDDDQWQLRRAPPLPAQMPESMPINLSLPARLRAPLARLTQRLTSDLPDDDPVGDVRRGVRMLRAVDLADRIARLIGGPNLHELGIGLLAGRATEVLLDPAAGPKVAQIVGPLNGAALARWIVPELARIGPLGPAAARQDAQDAQDAERPVGERLPAPVIALLAAAIDPVRPTTSPAGGSQPRADDSIALEVAVASASGRIAGDPRLRGPAVEYLLHRAARAYPDADPGPMVAEVFDRLADLGPWSAAELLGLVERIPPAFGAELVPIVLRLLPDWVDDPPSARLAAALLKRIQFLPRRGADGRPRPRRAGTTDAQAQLLNLLAASGDGWLQADDGLHRRAAEILMWGDRAWPEVDEQVRRLIAPRITVAAFQVALAAEPNQADTVLRSRLPAVPIGSGWRSAVTIGLDPALPMMAEVLRLNRYRLAGEMAIVSTRALLGPPVAAGSRAESDLPRLPMLPVGSVIRWLVLHEDRPELDDHLAALVQQELRGHAGPVDSAALIAFWERALPRTPIRADAPGRPGLLDPMLEEVLQVAFGLKTADGRPVRPGRLAGLLDQGQVDRGVRSRWWRRWAP